LFSQYLADNQKPIALSIDSLSYNFLILPNRSVGWIGFGFKIIFHALSGVEGYNFKKQNHE